MKTVSITMVYNEADVLELFVRHHLLFLDHMMLLLHGKSMDSTEEIALRLAAEGLPVSVEYSDAIGYQQSAILTELAQKVIAAHNPDLLLPLDADEFLCAPAGQSVRTLLETLPADAPTAVPWRTYVPMNTNDPIPERMTHRRKQEQPQFFKVIIPRRCLRPSLVIEQGSHGIGDRDGSIATKSAPTLFLAHLPIRSAEQAYQKARLAWPQILSNPHRREGQGFHWQDLYNRTLLQDRFTPEDLQEIAATYATQEKNHCPALVTDPLAAYVSAKTL